MQNKQRALSPCIVFGLLFFMLCLSPPASAKGAQYTLEKAIALALDSAAAAAAPLIDSAAHTGRTLSVPEQFGSIQDALDAANPGDSVVVKPGTYYERLFIREGIRLTSDPGNNGDELQNVAGALTQLPRRTLQTIIDGSKDQLSPVAMLTFSTASSRKTIIDGFTVQNLPQEDHHNPGHSHAINLRGASPVIMNCYVKDNGSTGIGNHVTYQDQNKPIAERDFRYANIEHSAGAVIYRNIVARNLGRGIGCNHFATSYVLGNEVYNNDDSPITAKPGPGIGVKHGASPTIIGNIVHDNPYGGIKSKRGVHQGKFSVDFPPRPTIRNNILFNNGAQQPGIACSQCGSDEHPFTIDGNIIFDAGTIGIAVSNGSVGDVTNNVIEEGHAIGLAIRNSTINALTGNTVVQAREKAFIISKDSQVRLVKNNVPPADLGAQETPQDQ